MTFHDRFAISNVFAEQCQRYFESNQMQCAKWGDCNALDGLPVAMRMQLPHDIRYQPDFFVRGNLHPFSGTCFGVDAKSGSKVPYCVIEKSAYETYIKLDQSMPIYVMTDRMQSNSSRCVGAVRVRDIRWMDSEFIVKQYMLLGFPRYPIDRDGWITPPGKSKAASGTPYQAIHSMSMNVICSRREWKKLYSNGSRALF